MRIYPKREVPPNSQFRHWRVIYELDSPIGNRNRYFLCECDCGAERTVRFDALTNGKSANCIECSKKHDHLYKQVPGCKRNIQDSHAWECWCNMLSKDQERGIPVCNEWKDFEPFLTFYLQTTGLSLADVLRGRTGWSFYHAERIDKEIGWQPSNTTFIRFVTERARHKPTYQYWWILKTKELLSEELLSYKEFVKTFGTKTGQMYLARLDITQLHSKENSYWKEHARRFSKRRN